MRLLKVTPADTIEFPLVLYTPLTTVMKLENVSNEFVAFKIKTTSPKGYLVRPSTGVIKPTETQEVQIILQPLTEHPKAVNDRFLVQFVVVPNDAPVPKDLWTVVNKANVQDHRLSVGFVKENNVSVQTTGSQYGIPPKVAARLIAPQSSNVDLPELRQKYDELVQYCLSVEKLKTNLLKENEQLRQKLQVQTSPKTRNKITLELWHVPVLIILFVILLKLFGHF
ncbi:vesicle-associated membrane protein [Theileria orientalis]|uniref:Vesicle-associated membrane protein n=1 Tax=Theileria orientalis TaxID=68886 RepID=A0A976QSQ9_THEOR|nr:vesicle-associated membrane protein [Theileria orientalis]